MTNEATILLAVDDTSDSLALLVEILTAAGYQVRPADSGELALAAVAANTPDLILLDVRMKGMDGFEVCRRLKARGDTRHIPIILLSAFADTKEMVAGMQLGAADYISKPFQAEELLTRVKTHLALSRANVSLEQQAAALRQTNEQLQSEIVKRQRMEDELRRSLERAERSRRAMLGTLEDQKRTEEALRESEERYHAMLEQAADAVFTHDQTGRILDVNQKACQNLGYSREELLSKSIGDIDPEAIQAGKSKLWDKTLAGEHFTFESRQMRKDGSSIPVEVSLGSVHLSRGPVILGFARDITERQRAEEALRGSETALRTILESTGDGILAIDGKGEKIIKANRRFAEMWGIPQSFIDAGDNRAMRNFVSKQLSDPDAFLKKAQSLDGTEKAAMDTLTFKDGRIFERHGFPMITNGVVTGRVWSFRDITERKRAETALQKTNRALRMISLCNQEMVRATDEKALLQTICQIAVEHGGYRMAWVGFAEQDEARSVRPVAKAGFEEGYLDTLNITWADAERGRGPTGTVIRTGQPVQTRNILTDPAFGPWRAAAIQRGYASSIALPLHGGDRCFGALMIYAAEPDVFDAEEVKLLGELANDLAYGIGVLRQQVERQRAEAALRQSQEAFKNLFDHAPVGFHELDTDGRIVRINQTELKMLGYSAEELLGQFIWKLSTDEETSRRTALAKLAGEMPPSEGFERLFRRKDGSTFPVLICDRLQKREDGAIIGIHGAVQDITERKRADAAVRESEVRYRTLFDVNADGILIADIETKMFKYANPALCQMLGYTEDELRTKGVTDIHPKDAVQSIVAHFEAQARGDKTLATDIPCLRKDGSVVHADINTTQITLDGKLCNVGLFRNITERKQAEEAMANERALLRTLVDHLPMAVYLKDLAGRKTLANPVELDYVGATSEAEVLGKTDLDLFPPERAAGYEVINQEVIRSGQPVINREATFTKPDGSVINILGSVVPVRNVAGRVTGLAGINFDITERKRTEERIADALNFNQTMLRASPVGIVVFKAAGQCISANEAIGQIIGGPVEAVLKQNFRQLESWKNSGMLAAAEAALAMQTERKLETQLHTTFGKKVWCFCRFAPFHYEGEPHLLLIISDITERKQVEAELRQSEARFRALVENAPEAITVFDSERGIFVDFNENTCRLFQLSREELLTKSPSELSPPFQADGMSSAESAFEKNQRAIAGESPHFEWIHRNARGEDIPCEINLTRLPTSKGVLIRGSIVNITERKRAEAALREKTKELDRYFTDALDLLCIADTDGFFRRLNKEWESTLGYSLSELEGRRFIDLVHPDDVEATLQAVSRLAGQGEVLNFVNRYRCKDGSYRWIEWRSFSSGTTIYAVARDITDRKQVEEKLNERMEELLTWENVTLGREGRVMELKKEVNELLAKLGKPPRYGDPEKEKLPPSSGQGSPR